MSVEQLLADAESAGATLEIDGDHLVVDVPGDFPDSLVDQLRAHKSTILMHLRYRTLYTWLDIIRFRSL